MTDRITRENITMYSCSWNLFSYFMFHSDRGDGWARTKEGRKKGSQEAERGGEWQTHTHTHMVCGGTDR